MGSELTPKSENSVTAQERTCGKEKESCHEGTGPHAYRPLAQLLGESATREKKEKASGPRGRYVRRQKEAGVGQQKPRFADLTMQKKRAEAGRRSEKELLKGERAATRKRSTGESACIVLYDARLGSDRRARQRLKRRGTSRKIRLIVKREKSEFAIREGGPPAADSTLNLAFSNGGAGVI